MDEPGIAHGASFRIKAARPVLALLLPLALAAGCGGRDEAALVCPRPAIINGLESSERHANGMAGPLVYRVALENIGGSCTVDRGDLITSLAVDIVVEPGPALSGDTVDVPYFVAVSSPNGDVIDRQDFVARITLPAGARRAGSTESFSQRFVGLGSSTPGYRILTGLALSREEALKQRQHR